MSEVLTVQHKTLASTECVLSASESYLETLGLHAIDAQPGLVEFVIRTQLLSAKNPAEKRVKSRTCLHAQQLVDVRNAIDQFLRHRETRSPNGQKAEK